MTQIVPSDLAIWGRLVKSWSTGLNYIQFVNEPPTATDVLPAELMCPTNGTAISVATLTNIADLITSKYLPGGSFTITIPAGLNEIYLWQRAPDKLYIALPQPAEIAQADSDMIAGAAYVAADFMCDLFGLPAGSSPPNAPKTPSGVLELTANLIGNYSIQNCRG